MATLPGVWWRMLGLMCLARAADLATTWMAGHGDLRLESNPIVRQAGGAWGSMMLATGLVVVVAAFLSAWAVRTPQAGWTVPSGLAPAAFLSWLMYGRTLAWHDWLWTVPPARGVLYALGRLLPGVTTVSGFLAAGHNLLVVRSRPYGIAVDPLFDQAIPLFTVLTAAVALSVTLGVWLGGEWRRYAAAPAPRPAAASQPTT